MRHIRNVLIKTDEELFFIIYGSQKACWNRLYYTMSCLGGTYFHVLLITLLAASPSTRSIGLKLGLVQAVVTAVVQGIKRIASRVRPYDAYTEVIPIKTERDFSFPSGHTAAAFSCAVTLSNMVTQITVPIYALAILIAYSRIYLGTHYPSDVVAGSMIGMGLAFMII